MSLIIYKCRICTVFWYKRRLIGLGARSEAPRQNFEHGCGRDSDCAPGTSTAAKKGLLHAHFGWGYSGDPANLCLLTEPDCYMEKYCSPCASKWYSKR